MLKQLLIGFACLCFLVVSIMAQKPEFAPGARYDAKIPSLKQVTGYDFAERVTPPEDIIRYLKALHEAAPDRTKLVKYAETWEKRELYALIVATPERIRQLEQIKTGLKQLANPSASTDVAKLARELPVVVALVHGVHGNEISSGEAAMAEAYHLLAAQGDAVVDLIRREAIVIIDPMQNPDGRARFVFQNLMGQAMTPDADPASAEHDEPWPGGRSNHYLFDLNRDWFAQNHPESQGRVKLLLEWQPQVVADLHEMGGDSTYYFPPTAEPPNPHMTEGQKSWINIFGQANAARFDERGFAYFNREVFDAFYPGYGVSWPMAQGAIGMTFEKGSARGLVYRRSNDTLLTYRDGAVEHFTAAFSTMATASRNREKLLREFAEFRKTAGAGETKAYLLPPGFDAGQTKRLVRMLLSNGVNVQRAEEPINFNGRTLPAGTFIVPLPQPAGALVRNLLDAQVPMNAEFIKEQEERRKRRQPDQIYDTTAWNQAMLYDVECLAATTAINAKASAVSLDLLKTAVTLPDATVGYALPWNATSAAAVIEALQSGLRVRFLKEPFTIGGRKFERGTAFLRLSENGAELKARLSAIAAKHGAEIVKLDSAFSSGGSALGSNQVVTLKAPRVLLAWDAPTSSLSAGWARFVLERRYGQVVTAVRTNSLGRVDLRRYDVLILPSGNYAAALGADSVRRIKDWIGLGGTLIMLGEASRWAARESTALLETRTEFRDGSPESDAPRPAVTGRPADYDQAIQPLRESPDLIPGAILRVKLDEEHWLSAGTDGEIQALVEGTRVFSPIKLDRGRNVGVYAKKDGLLASGFVWPDSLTLLQQKAFLIHQPLGQGHIIAFAEDPNYRAYAEATELLFINAVLLGTAH
ncbi:MAG TPA: M14 family metallopeptidase [Blastocatellia bacterium]|nr:M14 family metallopeptidase [Blastocatellia bacterium]HMZ16440.1 M14 family metallopeptidase [Blastocatellia bacterium]HNG30567.1 M14 family metallopeptidase [Blastocatellia bacterium]